SRPSPSPRCWPTLRNAWVARLWRQRPLLTLAESKELNRKEPHMGSKSSRRVAIDTRALALVAFPAGAAASKDYSQNSVSGESAASLPAEIIKNYSMNSAGGDY